MIRQGRNFAMELSWHMIIVGIIRSLDHYNHGHSKNNINKIAIMNP